MKVIHILPGSGGTFYCENCMRDSVLVKALRRRGHDVILVPMYLPIYTDDPDVARDTGVFFGGINCYLQQKLRLFRHTPRWLDRMFDSQVVLRAAARRAGSTRATGLGAMTLSMLKGPDGNQAKELNRLVEWLSQEGRPDVIHVSSTLLLGLARPLKEALGAPLVYTTMDEDTWVDAIAEPYNRLCWETMRAQAAEVNAFITVSDYYAGVMRQRLALAPDRISVVPIGIDTTGFSVAVTPPDPPVIGYLSRMSAKLGLALLVDAVALLKRNNPRLAGLKLRAMGGKTNDDEAFLSELRRKVADLGMAGDVEFLDDLDREHRIAFLRSLSVMSVPMPGGEAFGTFIVEALAAAVPVVQPREGGFVELVDATGGGILYTPNDAPTLARALETLLLDPARARTMATAGRAVVLREYSVERMAERTEAIYRRVTGAVH
jgi:glycosyltransferase involved in cell wall biosynthesis